MARPLHLLLVGLLLAGAPGCYLLHATVGQLRIVSGRVPIADVLEEARRPPEELDKLRLVLAAREFGVARCGLRESDSYTSLYETQGPWVVWQVSACEPDAFAAFVWSFPLVGALPYKGWFAPEPAQAEARELAAQGLDALVLPVPAFSTLGWFDDPVFSGMLREDPDWLVATILHELTHATVFVEADADWNENLAEFVGNEGARRFFLARGGPEDPGLRALERRLRDEARIHVALLGLQQELWRVYEASGSREEKLAWKSALLARFRVRMLTEVAPRLTDPGAATAWADPRLPLNNAYLLAVARYHGDQELFRGLLARCGDDLPRLLELLAELEDEDEPRAAALARLAPERPAAAR